MIRHTRLFLLLLCVALPATAKVSKEEADKLKTVLTPNGAEKAGNKDGTIPEWTGGYTSTPPCYKGPGNRYCDPFPEDKPKFTITAANVAQHKDKLSAGQLAMFQRFPDTYKMEVYETRRTFALPDFVYERTYRNALEGNLISNGEGVEGAVIGVPFPIVKSGVEPVWNHKLRYRGPGSRRFSNQAAVTTAGDFNLVKLREDATFPYALRNATPDKLNNISIYFLQVVMTPPRLAGTITLVHETMDQVKEARRAWQYNPGQRRLRRAPNVGYDNPGTGSDGLRTNDQFDMFNGATDRYTWKIVGKKEMYVGYNSYKIHDDKYKFKDIIKKNHLNQDLPRYELHRTWVVEANLKPGTTHIYAKRVFYIDEDTWGILIADQYDRRGALWRWQEAHYFQGFGDIRYGGNAIETVYDLQNNRYLAQALNNEDPETLEMEFEARYFDPSNVQKQATK